MTNQSLESQPVVLITGAARRIGAAIAQALHGAGMRVGLHYRNSRTEALSLCADLNRRRADSACCLHADLGRLEDIHRIASDILTRFGRLDVLINNASGFYPTSIEQLHESSFDNLIASNLKGPAFLISALVPALRQQHGCIINISDIHARLPLAAHSVYCAAKAGLESMTRVLALDLAPRIRVNGIAPGAILWPQDDAEWSAEKRSAILAGSALKRLGRADDIAAAALFLVRDGAYITGQILNVDGGRR